MFSPADITSYNEEVEKWNDKKDSAILNEMDALNIQHSKHSPNKIALRKAYKSFIKQRGGITNKISHTIPRSAIFLHKGVSRGHGKNNPSRAKEWYNPVIDQHMSELGDIVADNQGSMIINAVNIR